MSNVGVEAAFEQGVKDFNEGVDLLNVPGHYTPLEQELWQEGYVKASNNHFNTQPMGLWNIGDDDDDYDQGPDELDFN